MSQHVMERLTRIAPGLPALLHYRFAADFRYDLVAGISVAAITFFNATYFKQRALAVADASGPELQWFVIDAIPISHIDVTDLYTLRELRETLEARGVKLILAGRKTEFINWLRETGLYQPEHDERIFPTLRQALKAYRCTIRPIDAPPDEE